MKNKTANALQTIGILTIILGGLGSMALGSFLAFLGGLLVSVVSGLLFIGFAEIINLLQENLNITKMLLPNSTPQARPQQPQQPQQFQPQQPHSEPINEKLPPL